MHENIHAQMLAFGADGNRAQKGDDDHGENLQFVAGEVADTKEIAGEDIGAIKRYSHNQQQSQADPQGLAYTHNGGSHGTSFIH